MNILSKLEQITVACKERKLNLTKDRLETYKLICSSNKPLKAYDLLKQLKIAKHNAEPPTIYRALEFLEKNSFIHKINISNSYFACSHFENKHSCQLFLCSKCHEAKEFCNEEITLKLDQKAQENDFITKKISVEILGICSKCQN